MSREEMWEQRRRERAGDPAHAVGVAHGRHHDGRVTAADGWEGSQAGAPSRAAAPHYDEGSGYYEDDMPDWGRGMGSGGGSYAAHPGDRDVGGRGVDEHMAHRERQHHSHQHREAPAAPAAPAPAPAAPVAPVPLDPRAQYRADLEKQIKSKEAARVADRQREVWLPCNLSQLPPWCTCVHRPHATLLCLLARGMLKTVSGVQF